VSAQHPLAFVSEEEQQARRAAVKTFFDPATTQAERGRLLTRYRVSYLLAPRRNDADSSAAPAELQLLEFGTVAHADDRFLLVRLMSRPDSAVSVTAAPLAR
jgi:hypothetical protein